MLSPETQHRISVLRAKAEAGTITQAEMKEAVLLLRQDRKSAANASEGARRAKAKADIPTADDMLDELK